VVKLTNMKTIIFVIAALITITSSALANPLTFPSEQQRLNTQIEIPACHLTILEWRTGQFSGTRPSALGIKRLTEICTAAIKAFPQFLKEEQLPEPFNTSFHASVSIIPYNVYEDGMAPGNLNDDIRFKTRPKFYNEEGKELSFFGYVDREEDYIYIRNDVFTPEFRTVFSHELYHMLSDQLGTYISYYSSNAAKDEIYARKFTKFMGLGE